MCIYMCVYVCVCARVRVNVCVFRGVSGAESKGRGANTSRPCCFPLPCAVPYLFLPDDLLGVV